MPFCCVGALYRRYPSKEELLRTLCMDGLQRFIAAAEAALADHGDPWEASAGLLEQVAAVRIGDPRRTHELRRRYLALLLDALRAPSPDPLPGPAPGWEELSARWSP